MGASLIHPIPPFFTPDSEVLILGSFPSAASRAAGFFYGHPRNRFWYVAAALWKDDVPQSVEEKKTFLRTHHIALWDVILSCEITGSSDASIRNVQPNDLSVILSAAPIRAVFCNGSTSYKLFCRYQEKQTGIRAIPLPSTSPANASFSLEKLISSWSIVLASGKSI